MNYQHLTSFIKWSKEHSRITWLRGLNNISIQYILKRGQIKSCMISIEGSLLSFHTNIVVAEMEDRIAAAPYFPGPRRFPEGRNSNSGPETVQKHWWRYAYLETPLLRHYGNHFIRFISLPLKDMYPMRWCISAFLDFCYLARQSSHQEDDLIAMDEALQRFHLHRTIFERVGIRPDGFSLPRQHALEHYVLGIRQFGSPNGLCSRLRNQNTFAQSRSHDAVQARITLFHKY